MDQDHLEIILEDIRGKFELVLEGHDSLRREMCDMGEVLNRKIEHLTSVTDLLAKGQDELRTEVNGLRAGQDDLRAEVNEFRAGQEDLRADVNDLRAGQEDLRKELRATRLELTGKIDAVAADLAAHRADTEAHHGVYRVRE